MRIIIEVAGTGTSSAQQRDGGLPRPASIGTIAKLRLPSRAIRKYREPPAVACRD
jgi:hypothetical protein